MFSSSVHEAVCEENVCVTDEKFRHHRLYTDILQSSQTAPLLLQIFAPVDEHAKNRASYNFTFITRDESTG